MGVLTTTAESTWNRTGARPCPRRSCSSTPSSPRQGCSGPKWRTLRTAARAAPGSRRRRGCAALHSTAPPGPLPALSCTAAWWTSALGGLGLPRPQPRQLGRPPTSWRQRAHRTAGTMAAQGRAATKAAKSGVSSAPRRGCLHTTQRLTAPRRCWNWSGRWEAAQVQTSATSSGAGTVTSRTGPPGTATAHRRRVRCPPSTVQRGPLAAG
mmetsp:Transcript_26063/g.60746  ORF Transcript_26063/g.60746 Transcript_26063/m.60746 type:complete len:210 (-) Transcript_26063:381-1010(-)